MRQNMLHSASVLSLAAILVHLNGTALAQEKLKIGALLTLSGPHAEAGKHLRNGLELAIRDLAGKVGGRVVELVVEEDEGAPSTAAAKATRLVKRDVPEFVVGSLLSPVLEAILNPVTAAGAILVSPQAGPAKFAGKDCNPNLFIVSYQNEQLFEAIGKYAEDARSKRAVLLTLPQAAPEARLGIAKNFRGAIVDEIYAAVEQTDHAVSIARIAAARPDALFVFLPGRAGTTFVQQLRHSGLASKVPFMSILTVDETNLPDLQDAALGLLGVSNWAPSLDTAQNRKFTSDYVKEFGLLPAAYAVHSYDAILLIDRAVKDTGGNTADKGALRAAVKRASFSSLRGSFAFNSNNFPIQDFYLVKIAKRADDKSQTEIQLRLLATASDSYAHDCRMP
jgi:branched-chain amino acid transport system substrate-binding protein